MVLRIKDRLSKRYLREPRASEVSNPRWNKSRRNGCSLNFLVNSYRDYKDKFIIGSVEEIMQALDDHQLKVQSMLGSRYVGEIRASV